MLTGSLWGSGNKLRLNLQLSDAESGGMLWTSRREFDKEDIFRTQDEITREIVSALPGRIEAHWLEASRRKRAEKFVAYDYVLKAWDLLYEQGGDQHTGDPQPGAAGRSSCSRAMPRPRRCWPIPGC